MGIGITFDEKWHSFRDWGLELISVYIPMPAVKTQLIDVPGGDGNIDLTEINGRAPYSDRDGIELVFCLIQKERSAWFVMQSEIARCIHGRKIKLVLDDEPDYYYLVRLSFDGKKSDPFIGHITMAGTAEPFKYKQQSSLEEWPWDSFNFEKGAIQTFADVPVTTLNKEIFIIGEGIDTVPVFDVSQSNNLKLNYNGNLYELKVGKSRYPAIKVGKEDMKLTFQGTGKLSIDYRGRCL